MSIIDEISERANHLLDEMNKEDRNRVKRSPSSGIYDVGRVEPRLVENAAARTFRPSGNILSVEKSTDAGAVEVQCRMGEPIEENIISEYEEVFQQQLYKQGYDPVDVWTVNEDRKQDSSVTLVESFTVLIDFEGEGRDNIQESFGYQGPVIGEDEAGQQPMDTDTKELKSILGLGPNQDFGEFEGSPMDAAKQLKAEMGADTAKDQVDLKANVTNDVFLRRVQDAFDDMEVSERDVRDPYPAHGKSSRHRNPSMTSSPAETKDLKQAMGLSDDDELSDYPGTATEALKDVVDEYGNDKAKKLLQQAINVGADGNFLYEMGKSYNTVLDKLDSARQKLDLRMGESRNLDGCRLDEKSEDDPCQDGYTMVGTKTVDGEEVPNCVPNDEVDDYEPEESFDLSGSPIMERVNAGSMASAFKKFAHFFAFGKKSGPLKQSPDNAAKKVVKVFIRNAPDDALEGNRETKLGHELAAYLSGSGGDWFEFGDDEDALRKAAKKTKEEVGRVRIGKHIDGESTEIKVSQLSSRFRSGQSLSEEEEDEEDEKEEQSPEDDAEDMEGEMDDEDYSESNVKQRLKRSLDESHGQKNTRDMSIKQLGPTEKYVQNLRHNSVLGQKLAGIFRDIGVEEKMAEDLEEMHEVCKDMADKLEEGELDMDAESVIEMCSEASMLVRDAAGKWDDMKRSQ